ncbi:MAG: hypothetical protein EXS05_22555, partial [Planctomycetaceae bacterium]|nr:hypothetical protein [Planctomycetaceae bacterium]
ATTGNSSLAISRDASNATNSHASITGNNANAWPHYALSNANERPTVEVDTYLNDTGLCPVPCEVQLRTVFQDIWATIAHDTSYGSSTKSRRLEEWLRDMGKKLQQCEQIAECIAKDVQ